MTKLLGDATMHPTVLQTLRVRGGEWYAYQNHVMDGATLGELQFLQVGPDRTYKTPPQRMPDTQHGIGWRFSLVGKVDLESGQIVELT
jgi:hypothetical protein